MLYRLQAVILAKYRSMSLCQKVSSMPEFAIPQNTTVAESDGLSQTYNTLQMCTTAVVKNTSAYPLCSGATSLCSYISISV